MKESFFDFVQRYYEFGYPESIKKPLFETYKDDVENAIMVEDPEQREVSIGLRRREVAQVLDAIKIAEIDRYGAEKYKFGVILYFVDCEKCKDGDNREEGLGL